MRLSYWLTAGSLAVCVSAGVGCVSILGDFHEGSGEGGSADGGTSLDGGASFDSTVPDARAEAGMTDGPTSDGDGRANPCADNQKLCNGSCVGTTDPITGCADPGSCAACSFANGVPGCMAGACALVTCSNGFADCNGDAGDGCEVHTASDPTHCGTCTMMCSATGGTPSCSGGTCSSVACMTGHADCNQDASDGCEIDIDNDTAHCGTCTDVCGSAHGTPSCTTGTCTFVCTAPYAHCPTSANMNGCDVDKNTDNANCGSCGNACNTGQICVNGSCTCTAASCAKGCCSGTNCDLFASQSVSSCGTGGVKCGSCSAPLANSCIASGCGCNSGAACTTGQTCCASGCASFQTDAANCGSCGHSCGGGLCTAGVCQPWALASGRPEPPLNLGLDPMGKYLFWTENNNGGVYQIAVTGGTVSTVRSPDSVSNSAWAVTSDGTTVYWTDRAHGQIGANTIGSAPAAVWTYSSPNGASSGPYGITQGFVGGVTYLYAADFATGKIWDVASTCKGCTGTNVYTAGATGLFHYSSDVLWTDYNTGTVDSNGTSLATGTNVDSRYVTTDGTYVYWTTSDDNQVFYAPLNGSGSASAPSVISSSESQPWGIATDTAQSVYWVNKTNGTVRHAVLSGSTWTIATVATGNSPSDVRVDGSAIYWANNGGAEIMKLMK